MERVDFTFSGRAAGGGYEEKKKTGPCFLQYHVVDRPCRRGAAAGEAAAGGKSERMRGSIANDGPSFPGCPRWMDSTFFILFHSYVVASSRREAKNKRRKKLTKRQNKQRERSLYLLRGSKKSSTLRRHRRLCPAAATDLRWSIANHRLSRRLSRCPRCPAAIAAAVAAVAATFDPSKWAAFRGALPSSSRSMDTIVVCLPNFEK